MHSFAATPMHQLVAHTERGYCNNECRSLRIRQWPCLRIRGSIPYANPAVEDAGTQAPAVAPAEPTWQQRTKQGRLVVRPITREDLQAAGVVLTRAFAGSAEAVALGDVLKDIDALLHDEACGNALPKPLQGYFLVARLYPSEDPTSAVALPPGQDSRLIGTASLSLSTNAQPIQQLPPINLPPADAAYVSNMAVDPKFRRQGVARALLGASEDAARAAGRREVWLHVREGDGAARALYDNAGYGAVAKDSWLDTMKYNMRPRVLMRKVIPRVVD